jgi:GntR family transcriptional regulator
MQTRFSGKQDVYIEIAERYKEYIKLGIIKNGEKLPSVRVAAGELGVNPNTVARAYSHLEAEGYIRALPKKGAFVIFESESNGEEPDKKNVICALKDMGISRSTLEKWIEEVYGDNDRD